MFAYPQAQTPRRETGQPTAGEYYVNLVKRIKERDKDTAVGRTLGKVCQRFRAVSEGGVSQQ